MLPGGLNPQPGPVSLLQAKLRSVGMTLPNSGDLNGKARKVGLYVCDIVAFLSIDACYTFGDQVRECHFCNSGLRKFRVPRTTAQTNIGPVRTQRRSIILRTS